jgi:glutathione synthase
MTAPISDVLFIIDPLESLHPQTDTSLVMMAEGLRRGYGVYICEPADLALDGQDARASCQRIRCSLSEQAPQCERSGEVQRRKLSDFSAVFMRKDPPFDSNYICATWILDFARHQTLVINDPVGLRELNEKLAAMLFPALTPATRILRRKADLAQTLGDFGGKMIVKPILGFGGREILIARADDPNLNTLFEIATADESRWTVAQAFLPAAKEGDKRVLLVDGDPIGAVLRVPARGESRGNFHAGGTATLTELSQRDREISREVGALLRQKGQFFAGIDIIGGHLTEVNVTSPTGMQEINRLGALSGENTTQALFWQALERKFQKA